MSESAEEDRRMAGQDAPQAGPSHYARSFVTTCPATSVRRKSRPWKR